MDLTGLHFPDPRPPRNSIEKVKRQWDAMFSAREARAKKLKLMEELPACCQRLCVCDHVIPTMFLREMRRKYLQCDTQACMPMLSSLPRKPIVISSHVVWNETVRSLENGFFWNWETLNRPPTTGLFTMVPQSAMPLYGPCLVAAMICLPVLLAHQKRKHIPILTENRD